MFIKQISIVIAYIAMSIFVFISCANDNSVNPGIKSKLIPKPPTSLVIKTINMNTVNIFYDISTSEDDSLFLDYKISWKIEGTSVDSDSISVQKGYNGIEISGLEEKKMYEFSMIARFTNNSVSTPATNEWISPLPSPPSNLLATSLDSKSVLIKFDISPSETEIYFKDYKVRWNEINNTLVKDSMLASKGTNPIVINGLSEGKIYEFSLSSRFSDKSESNSITATWSPASRFTETNNEIPIRIYESSSPFGAGIQIFSPADGAPRIRSIAYGKFWDIGIRTTDNKIIFGSATKLGYQFQVGQTPDTTNFYKDYFFANSLNELFDSRAMNDGERDNEYSEKLFDITNISGTGNLIFYVRKYQTGSTEYNYAKIMIKRANGTGYILQGSAPNRYIELEISYQKTPGLPYAKSPINNEKR